ncbi:MAG: FAD:protein FMN transferase [Candidatus Omnitrophica bacterium]|nr:FAD:protein FMN transferase [Candidatus Omnitrophota bacterium]
MKRPFLLLFAGIFFFSGCSAEKLTLSKRTVPLMGTFVEIRIWGNRDGEDKIIEETLEFAGALEEKFNIFSTRSEINQLNLKKKAEVSPELYHVLDLSKAISAMTDGEFDVTIAPMLKYGGFYAEMPEAIRNMIPDRYEKGGWKNITLFSPDHVSLDGGVWVDASGIAKGYIVDQMADFLAGKKVAYFLINAGGDIYCGKKQNSGKWMVGLRAPASKSAVLVLALQGKAVATSGDYENCVIDAKTSEELSHIVDPSVPCVMKKNFSSMTVIASTCAVADALATAMMAMGKEKAIALADTMDGVEVISVTSQDGECVVDYSAAAEKYVAMAGCSVGLERGEQ